MNPSASGWISKFGSLSCEYSEFYTNYGALYDDLLKNGFVYGIHISVPSFIETEHKLSEDEIAKINLLLALYYVYKFDTGKVDFKGFINAVFDYYNTLELGKISFLNRLLAGHKTETQLEKLLDSRIYLHGNMFDKALGNSITNSLLFADVLLFRTYLSSKSELKEQAQLLECVIVNITYYTLDSKQRSKADTKLISLLGSSLNYIKLDFEQFDGRYQDILNQKFTSCKKRYLLDIACLIAWEDHVIDHSENNYIFKLGKDLNHTERGIENALKNIKIFFEKNHDKIAYLKDVNLASKYYEGMTKNVTKIILRNSKRLKKELLESRELLLLLTKSTTRELNEEERKKIQFQLLDLFKSIPSLAIFMLPGGAILLPIFIKLIPTLLPSAFDDNRITENRNISP